MKKGKLSKIAAIAMAFTMACGILSGCGGSQSAKTADSAANQTTESAEGQTKGTRPERAGGITVLPGIFLDCLRSGSGKQL